MCRVRPLASSGCEVAASLARGEQGVEQDLLHGPGAQPGTELAAHGKGEARIAQLQAARVLPVDAGADSIGRWSIRESLGDLHDGHERQPPRRLDRTPTDGEQRCAARIVVERAQHVPHLHLDVAMRKGGPRAAHRFRGNRTRRLGAHCHRHFLLAAAEGVHSGYRSAGPDEFTNGILTGHYQCKWSRSPLDERVLLALRQKTRGLPLSERPLWVLASRSGFVPALERRAEREKLLLVTPEALFAEP